MREVVVDTLTNTAKDDLKEIAWFTQNRWVREQRTTYLSCFPGFALDDPSPNLYCNSVHIPGRFTMVQTTYTDARANFAGLCNEVTENREIVVIRRRRGGNVAMIAADELESLVESSYLLRSPKNAQRLLAALERALKNEGEPSTVDELRAEVGLEE